MKITETTLPGVYLIEPQVFGDARGWFMESYSKRELEKGGIKTDFVQDNHSFSKDRGTLRGLHYQLNPYSQAKMLRCTRGEILDVAVDVRKGSPNYGKWVSARLSAENHLAFFIPRGFLHGFITLTDNVEVEYKADNFYEKSSEGSVLWNDPAIGIDWLIEPKILSDKDKNALPLKEHTDLNFQV
ncbi:MAG: dTDP-4-dehydrorhamnose 3,5-epimerase [Selenomonadaceae bacterium]|nr:dTDP-4-dehydrorhamnose 3,5-epimerase [Selenomonadaceae bacterium]